MRLWHKELIDVLPRQQLISQWRECCCIARLITEKETPNHILVNKIMEYDLSHFITYTELVLNEMRQREYKAQEEKFYKHFEHMSYEISISKVMKPMIFENWHTNRYFIQCYYNLQEKYDCGGISDEEWNKVDQKVILLKYGYNNHKSELEKSS